MDRGQDLKVSVAKAIEARVKPLREAAEARARAGETAKLHDACIGLLRRTTDSI
jgi:hypothetical protein